jgi:hypothetical protein
MRIKKNIFPTEALWIKAFILLLIISALLVKLSPFERSLILLYVIFSLLLYKVGVFIKKSNFLKSIFKNHVLQADKNRLAVAVGVIFLDVLHMLNFLFTLLMISSIWIFNFEQGISVKSWWPEAVRLSAITAGITWLGNLVPKTKGGYILSFCNFFIGLIFIALWIAIWSKAFVIVFRYLKDKVK